MRRKFQQALLIRGTFLVLLISISSDLFAYLDPSTGSMVVTAIVGIFASVALALKTYWYKFKNLFRRSARKPDGAANDSANKQ